MDSDDEHIRKEAEEFARREKKQIAEKLTSLKTFPADAAPVSVFMAGSPGAGKTEFSKNVLDILESDGKRTVRIDPDELRQHFQGYNGNNSYLFQSAVSILADKLFDTVIARNQNFIFDSTLSHLDKAIYNIGRSLKHQRIVEVFFIYQRPDLAWLFTKKRQLEEGRYMPKDAFIDHYLNSQFVVNSLKEQFAKQIRLNIVIKDIDNSDLTYKENVSKVDPYLPKKYTKEELEDVIIE